MQSNFRFTDFKNKLRPYLFYWLSVIISFRRLFHLQRSFSLSNHPFCSSKWIFFDKSCQVKARVICFLEFQAHWYQLNSYDKLPWNPSQQVSMLRTWSNNKKIPLTVSWVNNSDSQTNQKVLVPQILDSVQFTVSHEINAEVFQSKSSSTHSRLWRFLSAQEFDYSLKPCWKANIKIC